MLIVKFKSLIRKYTRDKDGVTAIEFGILALPFMVLIFGILELALVFFTTASLEHSIRTVSRDGIRTGSNISPNLADFENRICDAFNVNQCNARMVISVDKVTSTAGADLSTAFNAGFTPDDDDFELDPSDDGGALNVCPDSIFLIHAHYKHPLILPPAITQLAASGAKHRIIKVTQAVRTEPFNKPAGSAC